MSSYPDLHLYINGEWRKTADDLPVVNPATEEEIGRLPHAETRDLDDAVASAAQGFKTWRQVSPSDRANVLYKAAAIMRERQEEIATAITAEHGKPLNQARLEVIRGCEFSSGTRVKPREPTVGSYPARRAYVTSCTTSPSALLRRFRRGISR